MSFDKLAFVCLVTINLIGFVSGFVITSNLGLKEKFLKIPKIFQKAYVSFFWGAPIFCLPLVPQLRFTQNRIIFVIGITLALLSGLVGILAFKEIGIIPSVRQKSTVITSGIYGIIRHPLYLGGIFMSLGLSLAFRAVYALFYTPVIIAFFTLLAFLEEKSLAKEYGEEYLAYKRNVKWRLIPWVI